ncbi:hypothetical protein [uncultured Desulfovibrio sp.]|uniref:hypothetical protein n=1 Tax=uncultured Desulfovibrio sp. TaxID=167968 RepID=UPI0026143EFF|nr:hypothetical protein [uncultured Desulfovibrio sp.]
MSSQIWRVAITRLLWPSQIVHLFDAKSSVLDSFKTSALAYYIYKESLTKNIHLLLQVSDIECGYVKVRPIVFNWSDDYGIGGRDICTRIVFFKKEIVEIHRELLSKCEADSNDAELAALREENAALKAALEQARQERKAQGGESLTPQQKAAQVRSVTALNAWKSKIGAMVKVAVQIGKEGPKERQAGDFYAYFNELDVDLTSEQMKVFRAGVPDEYKDTVGGKVGKT